MTRNLAMLAIVLALATMARGQAVQVQPAPATDVEALIFAAADQYGVSRSLARAVLMQESGGDVNATSPVGAAGLMQVMPATAAGIAADLGVVSYDLYDPQTNATFGMYYLSQKIARYGISFGLAAYNWGPGAVDGFLARHPDAVGMDWGTAIAAYGGEMPGETQHYVTNILAMAERTEGTPPRVSPPSGRKCPYTDRMYYQNGFDGQGAVYAGQYNGWHLGVDFEEEAGSPVYAPFDMTVVNVSYAPAYPYIGWRVEARFDDGVLFYAGHLIDVYVQPGERVAACTIIGTLGATGQGPHVHIKIAGKDAPVPCEGSPPGEGGCLDPMTYWLER